MVATRVVIDVTPSAPNPSVSAPDLEAVAADAHWVERLRQGDPVAFDRVYEAFRAKIYTYFLRVARDEQIARGLSQETWLRLSTHASRLASDTQLGAWLFTVARNLFVSHRRWTILDRDRLAEFGLCSRRDRVPSPLELASGSATQQRLERAIGQLPVAQREVIVLVAIEGFDTAQAAQIMGVTPTTLRQRLSRARAQLLQVIDDTENGDV